MAEVAGIQITSGFSRKFSGPDPESRFDAPRVAGSLDDVSPLARDLAGVEGPRGVIRSTEGSIDVRVEGMPEREDSGHEA
jgi:hypothetical protein